ncbi:tudor domain-containing protein 1-like [Elysia marginata]|uniref:Tudor domain-containing protein 1-like n=1 Tax=Elysia marginata TaxID=1093978 RepID=A0AAV4G639_9GAST|nr:tudor domain-containing protein 1-like [Elysia marginata]
MLKPAGMFVKSLADFYLKTYGESLHLDALSYLQARPDCFTLEETIPGRIIVCPVPGASVKVEFNNNSCSSNGNINAAVPPAALRSPPSSPASSTQDNSRQEPQDKGGDARLQQLEKGSELEVIFSYAYSASEVYFQLSLSEDVIYEIEEELNQMCSAPAPSSWTLPEVGELVAASYEDGWYRAQIHAINPPKVHVYFIDYGNREDIEIPELRPLPQKEIIQLTPPLALQCALTPEQAKFFSEDTHARLEELSATHPVFKAVVLDNSDACIVELQQRDGAALVLHSMSDSKEMTQKPTSQSSMSTTDPDMLVLPDAEAFAVYICEIRTECSLLLRVVDTNYSDALDALEQVISDNFYLWPIPQEVKERHIYAAMILATADEAEDEGSLDQNKYHRVRVLRKNKDGSFLCYLPDHGDDEILQRNQLREIDTELNKSLPYQAVLATLHGLDRVEENLKSTAMEILLKHVNFTTPVYAVRHENSQALEIDIVDTSTEKGDEVNVNESVAAILDEVRQGMSQGRAPKDILRSMFGSSFGSEADSSSLTSPSATAENDADDLQASLSRLSVTGEGNEVQSRLDRVQNYVDDLPTTPPGQGTTKLYTWSSGNSNQASPTSPTTAEPRRLPPLPTYWSYTFLKSVSLYITWAESPSHFVAIPLEQQGALEKVETAMAKYFSTSATAAETLSEHSLYAVRSEGTYRRALYMGLVGGMAKIFFPDHHCYDTVEMGEVMLLPEQFYSLPFLAYKMRLRVYPRYEYKAMKPNLNTDWPDETTSWFKEKFSHKALYAVIFSQDGLPAGSKHTSSRGSGGVPGTLAVRLIDTSGTDDVIVDELMAHLELATCDASQEQV